MEGIMERKQIVKTYLQPQDGHKSFYKKAIVFSFSNGTSLLRSYDTVVAVWDNKGNVYRTWEDWSVTTGRHIKSAVGLNKKEYLALPIMSVSKALLKGNVRFTNSIDLYGFDFKRVSQNPFFGYNKYAY